KSSLVWFVDAAAFGTVIAYFMVSLSFCALKVKEPDLERPFKAAGGMVTGVIAVLIALFFASLYIPAYSPAPLTGIEWALVGGWFIIGVILFIANKMSSNGKATPEELEYLVFGEKYSRKLSK
ncbi:MAG: hypothetical protein HUJ79_01035, partial [Firmicutes bacterium]|nr:hypothetical protein [Bacillota bacterium]